MSILPAALAALLGVGTVLASAAAEPPRSNLRYDFDYPDLGYAAAPPDNAISRLQARLDAGKLTLPEHPVRGYLDALLKELGIDASSQMLIYSKTSLQTDLIDVETPRAVYFNDHTYIGYVHDTKLIEITTIDPKLGVLFYALPIHTNKPAAFVRETGRCLSCHDTYSMLGGGTPRVVVTSAPVIRPDGTPPLETSTVSTDRTPFSERWGGWYLTGDTGNQTHLGNLPLDDARQRGGKLSTAPRNLRSLAGLFDTSTYLTDTSDVVALLVLEHQTNVQNQMTRALYKARTAFKRTLGDAPEPATWDELPPALQKSFKPLAEPVAQAMLMEGVVGLDEPVTGSAGYERWFESQGPKDAQGRSLRQLDLNTRVFRYPLSYQLYTEAFDALPAYLRDYVFRRIEASVSAEGDEASDLALRREAVAILRATKPSFAAHARAVETLTSSR